MELNKFSKNSDINGEINKINNSNYTEDASCIDEDKQNLERNILNLKNYNREEVLNSLIFFSSVLKNISNLPYHVYITILELYFDNTDCYLRELCLDFLTKLFERYPYKAVEIYCDRFIDILRCFFDNTFTNKHRFIIDVIIDSNYDWHHFMLTEGILSLKENIFRTYDAQILSNLIGILLAFGVKEYKLVNYYAEILSYIDNNNLFSVNTPLYRCLLILTYEVLAFNKSVFFYEDFCLNNSRIFDAIFSSFDPGNYKANKIILDILYLVLGEDNYGLYIPSVARKLLRFGLVSFLDNFMNNDNEILFKKATSIYVCLLRHSSNIIDMSSKFLLESNVIKLFNDINLYTFNFKKEIYKLLSLFCECCKNSFYFYQYCIEEDALTTITDGFSDILSMEYDDSNVLINYILRGINGIIYYALHHFNEDEVHKRLYEKFRATTVEDEDFIDKLNSLIESENISEKNINDIDTIKNVLQISVCNKE